MVRVLCPAEVRAVEARAAAAEAEAENYRMILLRQQSIKGFWRKPHKGFRAKEAAIRAAKGRLATLGGPTHA